MNQPAMNYTTIPTQAGPTADHDKRRRADKMWRAAIDRYEIQDMPFGVEWRFYAPPELLGSDFPPHLLAHVDTTPPDPNAPTSSAVRETTAQLIIEAWGRSTLKIKAAIAAVSADAYWEMVALVALGRKETAGSIAEALFGIAATPH